MENNRELEEEVSDDACPPPMRSTSEPAGDKEDRKQMQRFKHQVIFILVSFSV